MDDLGVRIAADESAHTDEDAIKRIEMGYQAIALKAIAKTLSMTMKIAQAAFERNVPCFCADLTVNPMKLGIQVADISKPVASVDEMVSSSMMATMQRTGGITQRLGPDVERSAI